MATGYGMRANSKGFGNYIEGIKGG
jgi:hypothetical protein